MLSANRNVMEVTIILANSTNDQFFYISRISMIVNEYPFEFKRVLFSIKLCFTMPINKGQ